MSEFDSMIEGLAEDKRKVDKAIKVELWRLLKKNWETEGRSSEGKEKISKLLQIADPRHLEIPLVYRYINSGLKMPSAVSFMHLLTSQSELSKFGKKPIIWKVNDKRSAYRLMDEIEVRRPRLSSNNTLTLEEVIPDFPSVIKPVSGAGSTGVYLAFSSTDIFHAKTGEVFPSWSLAKQHAHSLIKSKAVRSDAWMAEELILGDASSRKPATDLKFYAFYGEIAFVSEIQRRPTTVWDFWTGPDERTDSPGKWRYKRFSGEGPSADDMEVARRVSEALPYPFMRIDMMRGENEIVFGEFTPRPGSAAGLHPAWDRAMGEAWLRAEQRISHDLLETDKRFTPFRRATQGKPSQTGGVSDSRDK